MKASKMKRLKAAGWKAGTVDEFLRLSDKESALVAQFDNDKLLNEPGVRLALATALYSSESLSLGKAAKLAGMALAEFMQHLSRQGLPVVRGTTESVREDATTLEVWLRKPFSATRAR
jgi:predicted HTH domain antitoxin